jgi:hypothetical protein
MVWLIWDDFGPKLGPRWTKMDENDSLGPTRQQQCHAARASKYGGTIHTQQHMM